MNNIIKGIIYLFTNSANGKQYVGQTIHERKRLLEHARSKDKNSLIDRAIEKYGLAPDGTISYEVIYRIEDEIENVQNALNLKEQYFINEYDCMFPNGYNLVPGGTSRAGWHPSDEARKKLSESHKGNTPHNKGVHWSDDMKQLISERTKQSMNRPETKAKCSAAKKGNTYKRKPVVQYTKDGQYIATHPSSHHASKSTNVCQSSISLCCTGKYKQAGGFVWKYA